MICRNSLFCLFSRRRWSTICALVAGVQTCALPISAAGALAGGGYTLLAGAEVPTLRSFIAALLVLIAFLMGREALTLRLVAAGALIVLIWRPESLAGPSFQLSFAAVTAIIALHEGRPMKHFLARREEPWRFRLRSEEEHTSELQSLMRSSYAV